MNSIFDSTNTLLGQIAPQLTQEGQEFNLRGITLPHWPVKDTALAACLATLGIPLRNPAPYTDDVALDEAGNELGRTTVWWLGDIAMHGGHKTEELLGAWIERQRFEAEYPLHPLLAMRAAIDARARWVSRIHDWRSGRATLPVEPPAAIPTYATDSIHGAAVLEASGFLPLAFNGHHFLLERTASGLHAEKLLLQAALSEGTTPPQWMSRVLKNYSHMLQVAKAQSVIIRQKFDDQTLLLTADSERKTRDKFHRLLG